MNMLEVQWKCERCGRSAGGTDEFCVFCGAPLGDAATSADDAEPALPEARRQLWRGRRPKRSHLVVAGALVLVVAAVAVRSMGSESAAAFIYDGSDVKVALTAVPGANAKPSERWSTSLDEATVLDLEQSGSTVFAAILNEGDHEVVAFDKGDGEERWRADLDSEGTTSLFMAGNLLIAVPEGSGSDQADNPVVEAFASDGELRWSYEADDEIDGAVMVDGSLLLATSDSDGDNALLALVDTDDGSQRWTVDGSDAALVGNRVAVEDDNEIVIYDASSGDEMWSADLDEDGGSLLGGFGSLVAVSDGEDVIAYRLSDGEEVWTTDARAGTVSVGGPVDDDHFAVQGADGGTVFDKAGEIVWDDNDGAWGARLGIGNAPLLLQSDEDLQVVNARTGRRVSKVGLDGGYLFGDGESAGGSPLASNAVLVTEDSKVTAYELPSLEEMWSVRAGDDVVSVLPTGDGLLVATIDGAKADLTLFG